MKNYFFIIYIASITLIFSQDKVVTNNDFSKWSIYAGTQSVDIIDKAKSVENEGYSVKRLNEFFIGFFKDTNLTVGNLPIKIGIELNSLGTSSKKKAYEFPVDTNSLGLHRINNVDFAIRNLNIYILSKWNISDRLSLDLGPSYGINLASEAIVHYTDLQGESGKITIPVEYDEDDFGVMLAAEYLLSKRTFINLGIYHGTKYHTAGRFNNLYLSIGFSF